MALTSTPVVPVNHGPQLHVGSQGIFNDGNLAVDGTSEFDGAVTFRSACVFSTVTAFTQTYSTADATVAAATAAALTVSDGAGTNDGTIGAITADASVIAAVQELAAQINKLVADDLQMRKLINKIIDTLQANGMAS